MKNNYLLVGATLWMLTLFLVNSGFAQTFSFQFDTTAQVSVQGRVLPNAWAGGLNAPQFSKMHLNQDTVEDLVVFDRTSSKVFTFLAVRMPNGSYAWRHAPRYEAFFPIIDSWMLLRDYDLDGRKDLFARTPAGVRVYQNTPAANGDFFWKEVANPLYTQGFSGRVNLQISASDVPGIADLDGDGDLDIVLFDPSGNFTEYHQNLSVDRTGKAGLDFQKIGFCWGNFIKEHYGDICFNMDCTSGISNCQDTTGLNPGGRPKHTGNTLLLWDFNGDGLQDVFFGHVTQNRVAYLPNAGTKQQARFTQADYSFPPQHPVDFFIFPATFAEDVTFDGKPDFLAAVNVYEDDELKQINFRRTAWLYENVGTATKPALAFRKENFLQEDMVDLGSNTTAALADIDGDGDTDLLVGYAGIRSDQGYRGGIALFRNTGTAQSPRFELETEDYLGLAASIQKNENLLITEVKVFVTDVTGDGIPDVGFAAQTFVGSTIRYIPNRGTKGGAFQLNTGELATLPLPEGFYLGSVPMYTDVNRDGKIDVLLGTYYGGVQYHRNTGTNQQPVYQLETKSYGGLTDNFINRGFSLIAADLNGDTRPELVTAYADGTMKVFNDFLNQTTFTGDSATIQSPENAITTLRLGSIPSLAVGDLNNDGLPDVIAGTNTGGLRLLLNKSEKLPPNPEPEEGFVRVYPNPTDRYVTVETRSEASVSVYNVLGQWLGNAESVGNNRYRADLKSLATGMYLIQVQTVGHGKSTHKIILR